MKSPFPGMDAFVEPHWLDVHAALIGETRKFLNRALPEGLVARVEERVAIKAEDEPIRRIGPDVRVFQPSSADPRSTDEGVVIDAPYKLVVELDPVIERFIRIIDQDGQLITVIEFISPSNKTADGLQTYRQKRKDLLSAGVHVVEIDLVREGNWRALMRPEICPTDAVSTYRAVIRTSGARPAAYLFPISLRSPLPSIPIPLRSSDTPLSLPLQTLFETVYEDGRYDRTIDYAQPLDPPLDDEEMNWMKQVLSDRLLK